MNSINKIINKYACNPYRYTIKNNVVIIDTDDGHFVFKKKDRNNNSIEGLYKYLRSRNFEHYPKLINSDDEYNIYEYVEDIDTPREQKAQDIMNVLSHLHNKTTYYKEIDIDDCKEIYEDVIKKLDSTYEYYTNLISKIEKNVYMSPSEYLLARNVSKIYYNIFFSREQIDKWYDLMKNKTKKRVATIHNNIDINHLAGSDNLYLLSWEKAKTDMPIYDLYNFYKSNVLDFDFNELFNIYERNYPLLEEEKKLLFILLIIPDKVVLNNSEYENCKLVKRMLDYIIKIDNLAAPYYTPNKTEEDKDLHD